VRAVLLIHLYHRLHRSYAEGYKARSKMSGAGALQKNVKKQLLRFGQLAKENFGLVHIGDCRPILLGK